MPNPPCIFKDVDYCAALELAATRYHKIVVVVGRAGSGKSALLRTISKQQQMPLVNLGYELSKALLGLTIRERKLKAADIVADLLDAQNALRLAVDNTEIVFDPSLMLHPLGLLQSVSRKRLLVWSWTGEIDAKQIKYAWPGHPEYQAIPAEDMVLISL